MIIDSHQHFWNYDPIKDAWIDDSMEAIRRDFLPKDLKPLLEKNGVDGCIAVQADQSEEETDFLLNCAEKNKFIKGVVGWLDLTSENLEKRLDYYVKNPFLKGLRHIVQAEKDDYLLRRDVQKGISKLAKYNLTYDILVYPSQLTAAITLVKKFPNQQFVLDHIAKPSISNSMDELWKSNIVELAKNQNVSCKLSGLVTETNNYIFNDNDFKPYIDIIFESFGPNRILFGSDWPVCLLAANYKKVYDLIFDYLENHSIETKAQIFGQNAIKIYNL
ncbi:MAG: amidohydrolase family protein [Candidatus Marinimicrobia bacterium]|jgi:L-fuconolactonase|nr:amidohydrolase family protein [Flavobacteriaceae bacterium]MBT5096349.1 amidohydrolase family protein [Candidatus Neomarinimicrobiota bacterium]MBT6688718.1 amidohydrolase family protein [Flavobacteriaceae bacterium]